MNVYLLTHTHTLKKKKKKKNVDQLTIVNHDKKTITIVNPNDVYDEAGKIFREGWERDV